MSGLFTIPISGLKQGPYFYDFDIDKEFFENFEESEVKEGLLKAFIEADKNSSHIDLSIKIRGEVSLTCDRCLEIFSFPVDCENRLLVRFGKLTDDSDPDIVTLTPDEHELDLKQYFYEYILLALPIKRMHPVNKQGKSDCDPEMLKKLRQHIVKEVPGTDSRWDELKKLMNN